MPRDDKKTKAELIAELDALRSTLLKTVPQSGPDDGSQPSLDELRAALEESEQRYRNLFENSVLGIYRTTPDGRILLANPALLRMLGYSSFDELAQRNLDWGDFEPRYSRERFKEKIEHEGKIIGLESAWVKHDGTTLFARENARVIRTVAGVPLYYEGTVEDITERRRAEEKLRLLLSDMSRVSERERVRAAARTSALAVENLHRALALLKAGEEGAEDFAKPRSLVERAARCILLVLAEIDPPGLDEHTLEMALESLIKQQNALVGGRFQFVDDCQPKPLDQDFGNLLLFAARELLLNVVRHARGAHCRLLVSKEGESVKLVVEDDGIGFDPILLESGTPTGLVSLQERLEATGGRLDITSTPGRGTCVVVVVPLSLTD